MRTGIGTEILVWRKELTIVCVDLERAEGLSHDERKAYAEQVVMAFWDAIGGDEEEIRDAS